MERAEWLNQMREKIEKLYDRFSPLYWVKFGLQPNEIHMDYLQKFLEQLSPNGTLLSAGCGAGRYDGMLLEAGHSVVGIDVSDGMLARARERFPDIRYEKKGLQEMDYQQEFDGAICIDALEHIFPEDWPVTIRRFREALIPGGILFFTLDVSAMGSLEEAYDKAKAKGLPVVYGEVAADLDEAFEQVMSMEYGEVPDGDLADKAAYHYYPSVDKVRKWLDRELFTIEAEGMGRWYRHYIVRKM